ncbi:hypothetical protein ACXKR8_031550 [Streptacidiphilus sp. PAMC 29251]
MIRLRVYVVNADTGEQQELQVKAYEPSTKNDIYSLSLALPPCSCPRCRPAAVELHNSPSQQAS